MSLPALGVACVGVSSDGYSSTVYLIHPHSLGIAVDEDSVHLRDGDKIGMYDILRTLGTGFFGSVKLAVHRLTRELVAIKALRRSQFEKLKLSYPPRELTLLSRLRHPNLALLYDVVDSGSCTFLVMEYVAGVELGEYAARKGAVGRSGARLLMRQLLNAVDYMHNFAHVCHRDLVGLSSSVS